MENVVYASERVDVVHGRWVEEPDRVRHWHCSACGTVQGIACSVMKYCPECGAKMDGEWVSDGGVISII